MEWAYDTVTQRFQTQDISGKHEVEETQAWKTKKKLRSSLNSNMSGGDDQLPYHPHLTSEENHEETKNHSPIDKAEQKTE